MSQQSQTHFHWSIPLTAMDVYISTIHTRYRYRPETSIGYTYHIGRGRGVCINDGEIIGLNPFVWITRVFVC